MRIQVMAAGAMTFFLWPAAGQAGAPAASRPEARAQRTSAPAEAGSFAPSLVGVWRSAPEQFRLTTDFDVSVWGPNASSVRTVSLTIGASGQGTLEVTKKVVDGRGRTVPASTSVEKAQIAVGAPQPSAAGRVEHAVKVASAERTYPDDPGYRWPLDGLGVRIASLQDGQPNTLEVRYDTPEGRGSFWETLRRVPARSPARPSRTP